MAKLAVTPLGTFLAVGLAVLLLSVTGPAAAQNCNCPPDMCCSQWGYCGTTADYCSDGCQSGPCWASDGTAAGQASGDKASNRTT